MRAHELKNHLLYNRYNFPISEKEGIGIESSDGQYKVIGKYIGEHRVANVKITTYGVKHFYARITIENDTISKNNNTKVYGYLGCFEIPKDIKLELGRPVNEEEIKSDPDRWYSYSVGDITNAFNSESDIITVLNGIKNQMFEGNWIIRIERPSGVKEYIKI